jgi:hypothetical protein
MKKDIIPKVALTDATSSNRFQEFLEVTIRIDDLLQLFWKEKRHCYEN